MFFSKSNFMKVKWCTEFHFSYKNIQLKFFYSFLKENFNDCNSSNDKTRNGLKVSKELFGIKDLLFHTLLTQQACFFTNPKTFLSSRCLC